MGEEPVLHYFVGYPIVTACLVLVGATGGHGWPKSDSALRTHRYSHQSNQVEQQRELLIQLFGAVIRLHGEQPSSLLLLCNQSLQEMWLWFGVGIKEDQHIAMAGLHTMMESPGFATPTLGKGRRLNQLNGKDISGSANNVSSTVDRMIINHDHFMRLKTLAAKCGQKMGQCGGLVASWDQHRDLLLTRRPGGRKNGQVQGQDPAQQPAAQQRRF